MAKKTLYAVVHSHFVTDHTDFTTSLVEATSEVEARDKFNKLASKRRDYPYMWSDACCVSKAEIIR